MALKFIERIKASEKSDGSITFPTMEFFTWTPGEDGELTINFKYYLQFRPSTGKTVSDNPLIKAKKLLTQQSVEEQKTDDVIELVRARSQQKPKPQEAQPT